MLVQFARHGHDSRDICVFRKLFRDNFCFLDVGVVEAASSSLVTQTKHSCQGAQKNELSRKILARFLFVLTFSINLYHS